MSGYILYGIEYNSTCGYDENGKWRQMLTGEKELYSATSTATLFNTRGKANARLKTHFCDGNDIRKARVVKFELKEVEE